MIIFLAAINYLLLLVMAVIIYLLI